MEQHLELLLAPFCFHRLLLMQELLITGALAVPATIAKL